jgi:hypothetical protein
MDPIGWEITPVGWTPLIIVIVWLASQVIGWLQNRTGDNR